MADAAAHLVDEVLPEVLVKVGDQPKAERDEAAEKAQKTSAILDLELRLTRTLGTST